jgi:hypothetical protein
MKLSQANDPGKAEPGKFVIVLEKFTHTKLNSLQTLLLVVVIFQ